jgi:hypothetical protein
MGKIIGKVKKDFELITKVKNMRLHPKGEAICNNTTLDILRNLIQRSYYDGRDIKILSLTKADVRKDFVFITLTT